MESNELLDKVSFIKDVFKSKDLLPHTLVGDGMSESTIFRQDAAFPEFILLNVSYHFQDQGWSVSLSVGAGYPENSKTL